jgi:beta-lactamase regulating signal transducer with metallopeptidase domain
MITGLISTCRDPNWLLASRRLILDCLSLSQELVVCQIWVVRVTLIHQFEYVTSVHIWLILILLLVLVLLLVLSFVIFITRKVRVLVRIVLILNYAQATSTHQLCIFPAQ